MRGTKRMFVAYFNMLGIFIIFPFIFLALIPKKRYMKTRPAFAFLKKFLKLMNTVCIIVGSVISSIAIFFTYTYWNFIDTPGLAPSPNFDIFSYWEIQIDILLFFGNGLFWIFFAIYVKLTEHKDLA
jgi:hypothetical protein